MLLGIISMIRKSKAIKLTPKDFRVGFELEFKSRSLTKKYGDTWDLTFKNRYFKLPNKNLEKTMRLGIDGANWELRTIPVCGTKARKTLKDAFFILKHFNAQTSRYCGLHINVSCKRKALHNNLDPIKLHKTLDPQKLARLFNREKSRYCKSPKNTKPWTVFEFCSKSLHSCFKHHGINFSNYERRALKTSRIEFRFPGGKDYHNKENLSYRTLSKILKSLCKSYSK
jgi:hypothetical protein